MKQKTIPRDIKKSFLVASFIGSVLKSHNNGKPILIALRQRATNGMQRFNIIAGSAVYQELTKAGIQMWIALSEEYSTQITEDEVEIFVELMGYILSPKDYNDFLKMDQFRTSVYAPEAQYLKICKSVLALNDKINELLGTKSPTIAIRKPKVQKEKTLRSQSKKEAKLTAKPKSAKFLKKAEERKRQMRVKAFLQERIESAKKLKEESCGN